MLGGVGGATTARLGNQGSQWPHTLRAPPAHSMRCYRQRMKPAHPCAIRGSAVNNLKCAITTKLVRSTHKTLFARFQAPNQILTYYKLLRLGSQSDNEVLKT